MNINFINRTNQDLKQYERLFHQIAKQCFKVLKQEDNYEIGVCFVRSYTIHKINRDYRGIDRITDVISFAIQDDGDILDANDLGDIFINIDYAKKQAKQYGHSLKREMGFLFTHGLLHCLGYDHQTEEEEKEMFALQNQIIDAIVRRK